jgi:hypothetical protein
LCVAELVSCGDPELAVEVRQATPAEVAELFKVNPLTVTRWAA